MPYNKVEAVCFITKLLDIGGLVEDTTTGIIQIDPVLYSELNKPIPGSIKLNAKRVADLAIKYIDLWPKKITSGGRPVRQGPAAITKKLTTFLNKHKKVTDDQILDATKRYIAFKSKDNYSFMTSSDYFIEKNSTSLLESYISNPELHANLQEQANSNSKMERMI